MVEGRGDPGPVGKHQTDRFANHFHRKEKINGERLEMSLLPSKEGGDGINFQMDGTVGSQGYHGRFCMLAD